MHKVLTDLGLSYRINKQFKLAGGIRYAYARKKDYLFTNDIRFNIDFKFKRIITKKFKFDYRFRFQNNYINLFTYITDSERKANARNRIRFSYQLKKHSIFLSAETFRQYVIYKKPAFNNLRLSLGDQLKTKSGDFNYQFSYEREPDKDHPLNFFFLKVNYTFKFKHE